MSPARARALVLLLACAAYANSFGNGFAYDDRAIIVGNPVVREGRWGEALLGPYWPEAQEGAGLYRPVTVASFAAEWALWGERPLGFHAVNVALHAGVSLLVLALLLRIAPAPAAAAGAALFAVHPVHVEAVANVVGRAELYAAAAVLLACLLYLSGRSWSGPGRAGRLAGIVLLYLLALGSKEIAVTLPAVLLLLDAYVPAPESGEPDGVGAAGRARGGALARALRRELPVHVSLLAALAAYLTLRASVLGTAIGEVPAPALRGLATGERVLTALTVWPEYLRLLVFPASLSADYAPGVLLVARSLTVDAWLGASLLGGAVVAATLLRGRTPLVALGLAWFVVTVLPVSNLVVPAGVLLAERTLYLPSAGASFALAGLVVALPGRASPQEVRALALAGATACALLLVRTVTRNPTWFSTHTVLATLAEEHPESYLSLKTRAEGMVRVGQHEAAAEAYAAALHLAPSHYALLTDAGAFHARRREDARAEALFRRAAEVAPRLPAAYRLLAELLVRTGRGREAHRTALDGLARAGPDRELWALVSESYILKGDLEASVRARRAALGQDPGSVHDWERLAELLDALGRTDAAERARGKAVATQRARGQAEAVGRTATPAAGRPAGPAAGATGSGVPAAAVGGRRGRP